MGRRRASPSDPAPAEAAVELRLRDPRDIDWAHSAEGWLVVYDPEVITDRVFEELATLDGIVTPALGWIAGGSGSVGIPLEEERRIAHLGRSEAARGVARLVRLAWEGSLMPLGCLVAWNGMDIRFTAEGLTAAERQEQQAAGRLRSGLTTLQTPRRGRITARGPCLRVTWSWLLGLPPRRRRELFQPGYQAEFSWPAGDYQALAWGFEPAEDHPEGPVDKVVVQLVPIPAAAQETPTHAATQAAEAAPPSRGTRNVRRGSTGAR